MKTVYFKPRSIKDVTDIPSGKWNRYIIAFDITIDSNGAATSITNFKGGRNNAVGDTITVLDASLGGGGAPAAGTPAAGMGGGGKGSALLSSRAIRRG